MGSLVNGVIDWTELYWLNGSFKMGHWWMVHSKIVHWWMRVMMEWGWSLVNESLVNIVIGLWVIGGCGICLQMSCTLCGMDNSILSAVNHSSNWYGCDQVSVFKQHIFNFSIMLVPRGPQNWQPREQCILQFWVPVLSVQFIHHVEWFTGDCLFERMSSCIYQMSRRKSNCLDWQCEWTFWHCSPANSW